MLNLSATPYISYDTETTGLRYPIDKAFGVSLAKPDGSTFYWDLRKNPDTVFRLNAMFSSYRGKVICHNASFDYKMSLQAGIKLPLDQMEDTVIRACCIDEHLMSYSLDELCFKYLGERKENELYNQLAKIFGGPATRSHQMPNLPRAPEAIVAPYAEKDALLALRLWEWQEKEINRQGIQNIVQFETELLPLFVRTEIRGIRVDVRVARKAIDDLTPHIDSLQSKINELAGTEVNVDSSPQIKKIFAPTQGPDGDWYTSDGFKVGTTDKGGPSINADVLREMNHPLAKGISELRSLKKTRDTFLAKHVLEHQVNGRVYPNINQSKGEDGGTGTGRLSYTDPAMQQIPNRNKKIAAIVKPCFLPEPGHVWVDGDMASFEVRVFAHLVAAYNSAVADAYAKNPDIDFHAWVAELMGVPRNPRPEGGANAKQLNLSMIFNSGNGAIAEELGLPWEWASFTDKAGALIRYKKAGHEAMSVIESYHRRIGGVKELAEKAKATALNRGYIKTYTGRRLRFPRGFKAYKASGLLIQATSADINKENWRLIDRSLGSSGHLILNTHDSYSMSIEEDMYKEAWVEVKRAIESNRGLRVPLVLDFKGVGANWWEAIKGDK